MFLFKRIKALEVRVSDLEKKIQELSQRVSRYVAEIELLVESLSEKDTLKAVTNTQNSRPARYRRKYNGKDSKKATE